jgi:hypothetical protein
MMKIVVVVILAGVTAFKLVAPAQAGAVAETLCSSEEEVVFACNTGKKLVSVCASQDFSGTAGTLQYRFGPKGAPEMVWPENARSRQGVTAGHLMYSGGGGAYIRFAKGSARYVVYSGIGKGWEKAGVAVEQNGKVAANLRCKGLEDGDWSIDGLPEDPEGFEIP